MPTKEAKDKAWESIMKDNELSNDTLEAIMDGFLNVTDSCLIAPYFAEYFTALEKIWNTRTTAIAQSMMTLIPSITHWYDQM